MDPGESRDDLNGTEGPPTAAQAFPAPNPASSTTRAEDDMEVEATPIPLSAPHGAAIPPPADVVMPTTGDNVAHVGRQPDTSSVIPAVPTSQVAVSSTTAKEPVGASDVASIPYTTSNELESVSNGESSTKSTGSVGLQPTLAVATAVASRIQRTAVTSHPNSDLQRVICDTSSNDSSSQSSDSTKAPFHPPFLVQYPEGSSLSPNPHYNSLAPKPPFTNIAANTIFRPEFFPVDMDDRLDQASIWMGIDNKTSIPRYFVPSTCSSCSNTHCDRAYPTCGRCRQKGIACVPGDTWRYVRSTKPKRVKEEANPADSPDVAGHPNHSHDRRHSFEGRNNKRTADDLNHTHDPYDKSLRIGKDPRASDPLTTSHPFSSQTVSSSTPAQKVGAGVQPGSGGVAKKRQVKNAPKVPKADPTLSADDRAYFARVEANSQKAWLKSMKGACPVWADTRRALCSAVDYLKEPTKTVGASVDMGKGGVARGVILEGQPLGQGGFWGKGSQAGTIVCSIGKSRPRRKPIPPPIPPPSTQRDTTQSLPTGADSEHPAESLAGPTISKDITKRSPGVSSNVRSEEAPEIAALCMAQRARSPVALAIADDWSGSPFRVPRKFIVLGWFWVADAWVDPFIPDVDLYSGKNAKSVSIDHVIWKFRFEWCASQNTPWWPTQTEPDRRAPTAPRNSDGDVEMSEALPEEWTLAAPGLSPSTTVRPLSEFSEGGYNASTHCLCKTCQVVSRRLYKSSRHLDMCLNESCPKYFLFLMSGPDNDLLGPGSPDYNTELPVVGLTPAQMGLHLRPTEPSAVDAPRSPREMAGKELWQAWVCGNCGKANERQDWLQWECGACGRVIKLQKTVYDPLFLRNPSRPICTGPRQDDGSSTWSFPSTLTWALFGDDIKVVEHRFTSDQGLGKGAQIFHALSTEGKGSHIPAGLVLRGLQKEVPLSRQVQPFTTNRPAERYLSPFYAFACGHDAPVISHFPVGTATPWSKCPSICLDAADLINERSGRMWPGQKERFNSMIVVAIPPKLPAAQLPHIYIQADEYFSFLFLGSDGEIRIRPFGRKGGEMKVQHGDVVGIRGPKLGEGALEVVLKLEGFGFVCLGRQVYRPEEKTSIIPAETVLRDTDFPALQQPKSHPRALPRDLQYVSSSPSSAAGAWGSGKGSKVSSPRPAGPSSLPTPEFPELPKAVRSGSHPVPRHPVVSQAEPLAVGESEASTAFKAKGKKAQVPRLEKASLSGWYIGPRPLDPAEPFRTLPIIDLRRDIVVLPKRAARKGTAGKDEQDEESIQVEELEKRWRGVVEIKRDDLDKITDLSPGPLEVPVKKKTAGPSAKTARKSATKGKQAEEVTSTADSPVPNKKPRGKKRPATQEIGEEIAIKVEDEAGSPSVKTKAKPRKQPRQSAAKGKGKGAVSTPIASSPAVMADIAVQEDGPESTQQAGEEDTEMADDDSGVGSVIQVVAP